MGKRNLFAELKRRHVYRVAVAYGVVGWLLIEVATQVFPVFHMPDWAAQFVVLVVALGFPAALVLAWAFEITPEGVRRTEPVDLPDAREPEQHGHAGRKLDYIIIAVLLLAVGLLAWRPWGSQTAEQQQAPSVATVPSKPLPDTSTPTVGTISKKSIAVLPFESLSEDQGNKYFADGMQDLILTKLAAIGELTVISRTSTARYASHPDDLKTIANQLGVANILEGSVQKAGNAVLINVQLISAATDAHIWAQAYTRTLDNVFGVEGEVAEKIADALKAKLSPAETKRLATTLSSDGSANDLFLRGEYFINRGYTNYDTAALKQAIGFYREAIAKVPDFALALARLSYAESGLAWFAAGSVDAAPLFADARTQAEQSLKLMPDLADAHLALGTYYYLGKGDYAAALKAFAAALALRPNDSSTVAARAYVLRRQGRFDEAIGAFNQALELDPRNTRIPSELAFAYMMAGRYPEAEQACQRALALDPSNVNAKNSSVSAILLGSGDLAKALAGIQGDDALAHLQKVGLFTLARKYSEATTLLKSVPDTPENFNGTSGSRNFQLAQLYRLAGDQAQAREFYAKALPEARKQLSSAPRIPVVQGLTRVFVAESELSLGQTAAGLAEVSRMQAAAEQSEDHIYGPLLMELTASLYAQAGRPDKAVSLLDRSLATAGIGAFYSPVMLWLDPSWDPIRKDPGFQALLKKYARFKPATESMAAAK